MVAICIRDCNLKRPLELEFDQLSCDGRLVFGDCVDNYGLRGRYNAYFVALSPLWEAL